MLPAMKQGLIPDVKRTFFGEIGPIVRCSLSNGQLEAKVVLAVTIPAQAAGWQLEAHITNRWFRIAKQRFYRLHPAPDVTSALGRFRQPAIGTTQPLGF